MVRRRGRVREPPPDDKSAAEAKIILSSGPAKIGAAEIGHQIIDLREAPGDVFGKDYVDAAASRKRECVLVFAARDFGAAMRVANQKLSERYKMIEFPHIQAWAEQEGIQDAAGYLVAVDVPIKRVTAKFPC
jgi:hypothetical protein